MYGMNNVGKLFSDELTEWLIEAGFVQYQFHMSIYYKYAPYGRKWLFNLILMIVSIGINMNLLEFYFWGI